MVSFAGVYLITGKFRVAASILQTTAYNGVNDYIFAVIPLFVLMGLFATQSGRDARSVRRREALLRRVRGGVGIATVIANAIFAAITGVSVASAAVFSKLAIPEMNRLGYDRKFGLGIVASSALLGMLIPPSILMIVYGVHHRGIDRHACSPPASARACVVAGVLIADDLGLMVRFDPRLVGREGEGRRRPGHALALALLIKILADLRADRAGARRHLRRLLHADRGRRHRRARRAGADRCCAAASPHAALMTILLDTGKACASIFFLLITAQMYSRMLTLSRPAGNADAPGPRRSTCRPS